MALINPAHALAYAEHVLRTLEKLKAAYDTADTQDQCIEWRRKIGNAVQYQRDLIQCLKEQGFGNGTEEQTTPQQETAAHAAQADHPGAGGADSQAAG